MSYTPESLRFDMQKNMQRFYENIYRLLLYIEMAKKREDARSFDYGRRNLADGFGMYSKIFSRYYNYTREFGWEDIAEKIEHISAQIKAVPLEIMGLDTVDAIKDKVHRFFGNITGQVESILEDLESIEENDEASIL